MDAEKPQLKEMSFWDHLDELRSVLVRIAVVLLVLTVGLFAVMPTVFDRIILAPCRGDFVLYRLFEQVTAAFPDLPQFSAHNFHVDLINIQLASQFFIHMSTSFWLALVLGFPIVIYLLWTFVEPALYPNEKRGARRAFFMGIIMFFMGVAVGYFIVFPITLRFLADYHVSAMVPNQISLDSYMDTFLMLIFIMGLVFELPLVAWLMGVMGVLHREFFGRYRRHAIVALLILAAFITPTGDPFTLTIVFLPVYALYELSAFLVKPTPKTTK
ncbi:MAG: twin-arginine translocase subunit TatC [Muribaculaceae bacterium]|nr:twin-arginine translocase subunit TatC [Muribaculaceae bacterium]